MTLTRKNIQKGGKKYTHCQSEDEEEEKSIFDTEKRKEKFVLEIK